MPKRKRLCNCCCYSQHRQNNYYCAMILRLLMLLLMKAILADVGDAVLAPDGQCPLFVFIPFTNNGTPAVAISTNSDAASYPGLSYTASALMAMNHFNDRNSIVVPELLNYTTHCNVTFDLNNTQVLDTGTTTHLAAVNFINTTLDTGFRPCAMAGTFNEVPADDISTMAHGSGTPFVLSAADNARIFGEAFNPFTAQVFPDTGSSTGALVSFLLSKNRTNYISYFYAINDANVMRQERLDYDFDAAGMESFFQPFLNQLNPLGGNGARGIFTGLKQVKDRGFRTIVVSFDDVSIEGPALAKAAEELNMNNGEYFWVLFGRLQPDLFYSYDPLVAKLLQGAAWVIPLESYMYKPKTDPFLKSWRQNNAEFAASVNRASPILPNDVAYSQLTPDYFQKNTPEYFSGFMYDSIMSVGIGACIAQRQKPMFTTQMHLDGIRAANFTGATGTVYFGNPLRPGSRNNVTFIWGCLNILDVPVKKGETFKYKISDVSESNESKWEVVSPFVYFNGSTKQSQLLRDPPNMNYLGRPVRAAGLTLMSIVLILAVATHIGVYLFREHRVVRAAQPFFLHMLATGSIVSVLAILPLSFDESYGMSEKQLSRACMAIPWLTTCGTVITYGALFSKLWRVEQVLQFTRRKITTKNVAWPLGLILFSSIVVLSIWTIVDSLVWERIIIDDFTGESIGRCTCDKIGAFLGPIIFFILIPLFLTAIMAKKTSDVDESFSEGYWIFILLVIQLEVILVAAPFVAILRDLNINGRYFGYVIMLWIFPTSTLAVIIVPKINACIVDCNGGRRREPKRGERSSEIRVTGLHSGGAVRNSQQSSTGEHSHISTFSVAENNNASASITTTNRREGITSIYEMNEQEHELEQEHG